MSLLWVGLVIVIETTKWVVKENTPLCFAIWILQFYWMASVLMYEGFGDFGFVSLLVGTMMDFVLAS
ncbi:hypothetical protein VN97_g10277 [Penicillium thymicola]|uniref:Uncharacterized protein n=1 Tax=Penicillium thymicola TaxID=293382 RepID=A0AAI9X3Z1_PENTH|nr:hypothetical protein VN97_g10277 [Penicillium thymicola]